MPAIKNIYSFYERLMDRNPDAKGPNGICIKPHRYWEVQVGGQPCRAQAIFAMEGVVAFGYVRDEPPPQPESLGKRNLCAVGTSHFDLGRMIFGVVAHAVPAQAAASQESAGALIAAQKALWAVEIML